MAGWLRLRDADGSTENAATKEAEQIFRTAHNDLQDVVGKNGTSLAKVPFLQDATGLTGIELGNIAVPGLARSLFELGRTDEARELRKQVDAQVGSGSVFCARMAAAVRAPPAEILALLAKAGETAQGAGTMLGSRQPEMAEFLEQVKSGDSPELQDLWDKLPPMMRAEGDNPISPWCKIKCRGRVLYTQTHTRDGTRPRDNIMSLVPPTNMGGVCHEVEVGMQGLYYSEEEWEIAYAELGGEDCLSDEQLMSHRNAVASRRRNAKLKQHSKCGCVAGILVVLMGGILVVVARVADAVLDDSRQLGPP
jgi:hypothetical protein